MALDVPLPTGAEPLLSADASGARLALPTGPWSADAGVPVRVIEGNVTRLSWRIPDAPATPGALLAPIREALVSDGFEVLLDCADRRCGGFDFRFAIDVVPAPEMYVDLANYRFLSARKGDGQGVTVLTSRNAAAGYVQVLQVVAGAAPEASAAVTAQPGPAPVRRPATGDIATLEAEGAMILSDARFDSGTASLGAGPFPQLDALVAYLADNSDRRVLLVGHTDAVGSLEGNRALSQRRAGAVAAYLRDAGADPAQIAAEGAGYLAPIASNLTEAGRRANRRVEAVLLPRE